MIFEFARETCGILGEAFEKEHDSKIRNGKLAMVYLKAAMDSEIKHVSDLRESYEDMRLSGISNYALERSYKRLEDCLPRLEKLIDYSSAIDEAVEKMFKEKTGVEEDISKLRDVHEQLEQYLADNS